MVIFVKKIKIVTVCQFGMGTTILMMTLVKEICAEEGIPAEVYAENIDTVRGHVDADIIVTNAALVKQLEGLGKPVVGLEDFVNKEAAKKKLWEALEKLGYTKESFES